MKSKTLFYLILLTFFALLIPAVHAQTFSVIHNFTVAENGGSDTGVTIRGNALYIAQWGITSYGSVCQLTYSGSNWLFSPLATFLDSPISRAVFGPDGHLYSTTYGWGGGGFIFNLTPQVEPCRDLKCLSAVNILHRFGSGKDGSGPTSGALIWDQQGNIYDTTGGGGMYGKGTVYKITPTGNGYTEKILYSFSGPDGAYPWSGLVFDSTGNLFGTTASGGSNNSGTVFELSYVPGVGWAEHVLYSFQNGSDGSAPVGVVFDSAGNLYGATFNGGSGGGGTIFELSPSGNTWVYKLLYSLTDRDNCGPVAPLSMDGASNLYGTTQCGGIYNSGSIFKLSNTQNGWVYTSLHDFTGGNDGGVQVRSNVAIDTDGTLYGTALGGQTGHGVVWMIKPEAE